jgi:hypothetical protein
MVILNSRKLRLYTRIVVYALVIIQLMTASTDAYNSVLKFNNNQMFRQYFDPLIDLVVNDSKVVFSDLTSVPYWLGKEIVLSGDFANYQMRNLLDEFDSSWMVNEIIKENPDLIIMGSRFTSMAEVINYINQNYYAFCVFESSAGPPRITLLYFKDYDKCMRYLNERNHFYNSLDEETYSVLREEDKVFMNYYLIIECNNRDYFTAKTL